MANPADINCILGAMPDYVTVGSGGLVAKYAGTPAVVTAGSEASTDTVAANLQDELLFRIWRSSTTTEHETVLDLDLQQSRSIGSQAWPANNFSPDARIRVQMHTSAIPGYTRLAPTSEVIKVNMTGAVTDIDDDPESPDGAGVTTTGSPFTIGYSFPTPSSMSSLADVHRFRVRIAAGSIVVTGISLYESGTLVRQLAPQSGGAFAIPTADTILYAPFSASELADTSGADIEIRVTGYDDSAPGGEIMAIDLQYTPSTGTHYDSGFYDAWPTVVQSAFEDGLPEEVWLAQLPVRHHTRLTTGVYDAAGAFGHYEARYVRLEIRDPHNADGFVEAGRWQAGGAFISEARAYGAKFYLTDESEMIQSAAPGLRDVPSHRVPKRGVQFALANIDQSEAFAELFRFLGLGGRLRSVIVDVFPDDPDRAIDAALIGHMRDTLEVQEPHTKYALQFDFLETR